MGHTCKISTCEKRHKEFASLYVLAERVCSTLMLMVFLKLLAHRMAQKNGIFHGQPHQKSESCFLYNSNNFLPFLLLNLFI